MNHTLDTVMDSDKCFIIDPITRTITNQAAAKNSLIQYDHNSEVFTFKIPREIEGHDMFESDAIEVHFINKGQSDSKPGIYYVTDQKVVTEDDSESVTFSWLISQNATQLTGDVSFQIKFICYREDSPTVFDYVWSTKVYSAINVLPGINNADIVMEQYIDILEQWKSEIEAVGKSYNEDGEIFNDYESNKAISQGSHAEGIKTFAGMKGFNIISVGVQGSVSYVYLDSVEGLEVGDIATVRGKEDYPNLVISSIDKTSKRVTFAEKRDMSLKISLDPNQIFPWHNKLTVNAKPEIGTCEIGYGAHAEGGGNRALRVCSHAEGIGTEAIGEYSHTEGRQTKADWCAHAEGDQTVATGWASHAEGSYSKATGHNGSHAEGENTEAVGRASHAEGFHTSANSYAHAEGHSTVAAASCSHAEGGNTNAYGQYSHAEGYGTFVLYGDGSHAEGYCTISSALGSHAEGQQTEAHGTGSHSEGRETYANGVQSHTEGYKTYANNFASHAEGNNCKANGDASHVEGVNNTATMEGQHVQGKHAVTDTENKYAHIVGWGDWGSPKNIHTIDWQGNAYFSGTVEGTALILKSPNGTRFKVTVNDNGNLTTVKA